MMEENEVSVQKLSAKRQREENTDNGAEGKTKGRFLNTLQNSGVLLPLPKGIVEQCAAMQSAPCAAKQLHNFLQAALHAGLVSVLKRKTRKDQAIFLVTGMIAGAGRSAEKVVFLDITSLAVVKVAPGSRKNMSICNDSMLQDGQWGAVLPKSLKLVDIYDWAVEGGKRTATYDPERNVQLADLFGLYCVYSETKLPDEIESNIDTYSEFDTESCTSLASSDTCASDAVPLPLCDNSLLVLAAATTASPSSSACSPPDQQQGTEPQHGVVTADKVQDWVPGVEMAPSSADVIAKIRRAWELRSIIEFMTQSIMAARLEYEVVLKNLSHDNPLFAVKKSSSSVLPNVSDEETLSENLHSSDSFMDIESFIKTYIPSEPFPFQTL